jgi:hypothetical protein
MLYYLHLHRHDDGGSTDRRNVGKLIPRHGATTQKMAIFDILNTNISPNVNKITIINCLL